MTNNTHRRQLMRCKEVTRSQQEQLLQALENQVKYWNVNVQSRE